METSTIVSLVQADLFDRESRGLQKYNTTVDRTDLTEVDWLQHAYEEALDMAVYLKKIIQDKKLSVQTATAIHTSVTFNGKTYNLVEASNESVKIEEVEEPRKFKVEDKVRILEGDVSKCFGTIGTEGNIEYVSPSNSAIYPYKVGNLYYPATELQFIEE